MSNASPVQRGFAAEGGDFGPVRSKKPFCNAFTGCGRKRSDPEMAEEELMNLLVQRIQGIRDQEVGYSNAGVVKRQNFEDYILN